MIDCSRAPRSKGKHCRSSIGAPRAFKARRLSEGDRVGTTVPVQMTVNGQTVDAQVEPRMLLVHYIRDVAGLTGTHIGCDTSNCGACTCHVDGDSVKSCTVLAVQADGSELTTIEGMADEDGTMHPLQEAFW